MCGCEVDLLWWGFQYVRICNRYARHPKPVQCGQLHADFQKATKKTKNTKENIDECVYFCDMKDILNIVW